MGNALHTKGAGSAGVTGADEARLNDGGLLAIGSGGLVSTRTGVLVGPGATSLVSGTSSTSPMRYSVAAHHWVTNRGVVSDGVYRGAAETAKLVDTTAAPGSGSRIDIVYVKQNDAGSTLTPDATSAPVYGCVQGASSTGTPTPPTLPVGAEELARVTVTSAAARTDGAGVTISQTAKLTTGRGGPVPIRTAAELAGLPAYPSAQALELDTGRLRWHDGTRWRYDGDQVTVASTAERDLLTAYDGLQAVLTSGAVYLRQSGTWVALKGGPWTTFPLVGAPFIDHTNLSGGDGVAPGPGSQFMQYRREGDRVYLRGWTNTSTTVGPASNGSNPLSTALPAEVRPPQTAYLFPSSDTNAGSYGGNTAGKRMEIGTNGILYSAQGLPNGQYLNWDGTSYSLT